MASENLATLPPEMLGFVLRQGEFIKAGLRLGQLSVAGHPAIATPSYIVPTSRGIIPHVTQDNVAKLTHIPAVHIGLEDFIEKTPQKAPIFRQDQAPSTSEHSSRLRDFVSLPNDCVCILGPRRVPAVECPNQNTNSSIAISTSVGFQSLRLDDYVQSAQKLQADITLSLADMVTTKHISQKRLEKSADRTHAWMRDTVTTSAQIGPLKSQLFAAILPLEGTQQSFYLSDICDEYRSEVSGVSLSSPETASEIPEALQDLPRICLVNPDGPHDILRTIALGNDLITVPFSTRASEDGIALSFSFAVRSNDSEVPLGFDLWDASHATQTGPLVEGCTCYTCTKHHRGYVQHLLSAKEMLAWTLLQIHNFRIIHAFFEQVREAIADGTFEEKVKQFSRAYSKQMPTSSGEGPRIRGYQMKSVGRGEPKKNRKAYGRLDEHAEQVLKLHEAESGVATPESGIEANELEKHGLGKPQE